MSILCHMSEDSPERSATLCLLVVRRDQPNDEPNEEPE
jgi:hypothetical protein